jgi:hypothetical protein
MRLTSQYGSSPCTTPDTSAMPEAYERLSLTRCGRTRCSPALRASERGRSRCLLESPPSSARGVPAGPERDPRPVAPYAGALRSSAPGAIPCRTGLEPRARARRRRSRCARPLWFRCSLVLSRLRNSGYAARDTLPRLPSPEVPPLRGRRRLRRAAAILPFRFHPSLRKVFDARPPTFRIASRLDHGRARRLKFCSRSSTTLGTLRVSPKVGL